MLTNHNTQITNTASHTANILTKLFEEFNYSVPNLYEALFVTGTVTVVTDTPLKEDAYNQAKVVLTALHNMGITTLHKPRMNQC